MILAGLQSLLKLISEPPLANSIYKYDHSNAFPDAPVQYLSSNYAPFLDIV